MSSREKNLRFPFGSNWQDFVQQVGAEQIAEAERSLQQFLELETLTGCTFLDVGCGSGLFSLAARRLGARVLAFDYDAESVESARALRERFAPGDLLWRIEPGSVLDRGYLEPLGPHDIVYAWGVLHHTGALCRALYNVHLAVKPGGRLYLAVYNHQGLVSEGWRLVKRVYCSGPVGRLCMTASFYPAFFASGLLLDLVHGRDPRTRFREHKKHRGMSLVHDWKDWLGGFPYEPARPETVMAFYENLGYRLRKSAPPPIGFGNNQFVFEKTSDMEEKSE